jgi:hypothetical protein
MSQRDQQSRQFELERETRRATRRVTQWVIHCAAGRAPEYLSSRLEEEWLADSECRSTALSRLRFAVGCCWATVVIAHEFQRAAVPAAISAPAARGFVSVADRNIGYFSLRSGTLFLIVGIHAAVFCGLVTMLSHSHGLVTPGNSRNQVLETAAPDVEIAGFFPAR